MGKTASKPKNVEITPNGGTKGVKKMKSKRVVADFGTYKKVVNALSQAGVYNGSMKKQPGDKDVGQLNKSVDSLTESVILFGHKYGFDKINEAFGQYDEEQAVLQQSNDFSIDHVTQELEAIAQACSDPETQSKINNLLTNIHSDDVIPDITGNDQYTAQLNAGEEVEESEEPNPDEFEETEESEEVEESEEPDPDEFEETEEVEESEEPDPDEFEETEESQNTEEFEENE